MKPWLLLSAKMGHDYGPIFLDIYSKFMLEKSFVWKPFEWRGLHFKNRLGIAGGVDKNGKHLRTWQRLGAGFVEVGTVTPRPQQENAGANLLRDIEQKALWNYLGFPNEGADSILKRLSQFRRPYKTPVFINIGRNRDTENQRAHEDYEILIKKFKEVADVFVVNISSPNTRGLRDIQSKENLKSFLEPLRAISKKPLLLKLSPDLTIEELDQTLETSLEVNIDGWIFSNTTTERLSGIHFPRNGGVSGRPLREKSLHMLKTAVQKLGNDKKDKLIVSVGGVLTPQDVLLRLAAGADLVQIYSALIFEGPSFFQKVADILGDAPLRP